MQEKSLEKINYSTEDGSFEFGVQFDNDTVWLSQKDMAGLFGKTRVTITEHIGNIFKEGELDENSVCRNFRLTASDGKKYNIEHYNLDVIISVGYRVKSKRGTQFRIWATKVLKRHLLDQKQVSLCNQLDQIKEVMETHAKQLGYHETFHIETYEMIRYLFEKIEPETKLIPKNKGA